MHKRPIVKLAVVAIALGILAACDQGSLTLAGIGASATTDSTTPLHISPATARVNVGATVQLSTNAPTSLQTQLQWSSLSSTLATVSPTGVVTGFADGQAVITVRYAFDTTNTASATVTVQGSGTADRGVNGKSRLP